MARNAVKTRQAAHPSRVRRGDIDRAFPGSRRIAEALPGRFSAESAQGFAGPANTLVRAGGVDSAMRSSRTHPSISPRCIRSARLASLGRLPPAIDMRGRTWISAAPSRSSRQLGRDHLSPPGRTPPVIRQCRASWCITPSSSRRPLLYRSTSTSGSFDRNACLCARSSFQSEPHQYGYRQCTRPFIFRMKAHLSRRCEAAGNTNA